jgi:hypothetical protein
MWNGGSPTVQELLRHSLPLGDALLTCLTFGWATLDAMPVPAP